VKLNITENKLENATVELQIEVPVEKVEIEYKAVFDKIKNTVKIDGFRKGKAPVQLVETHYKDYANQEVAENLIRMSFWEAIAQKEITPISEPRYEFDAISRDDVFKFKAVFEVPPTMELGTYKEIAADEKACNVTEDDIKMEIESIRERFAETSDKGEGGIVENGDVVKILVKRIDDIEESEIEKAEYKEYSIVVGKSKDEFTVDKQILGLKEDEEKEAVVDYPADYYSEEFAGKKVTYLVKIAKIESMTLPEMNEELAEKAQYESVEDMKKKTEDYVNRFVTDRTIGDAKSSILNTIIENSKFDLPSSMIEKESSAIFKKTQQRIGYFMEDMDQFATALGLDPVEFKAKMDEEAAQAIKTTLVLNEIVEKEEMILPEGKYTETLEKIAESNGKSVEEIEKMIQENNSRENVEKELLLESALDFIYMNAKINKLEPVTLEQLMKQK